MRSLGLESSQHLVQNHIPSVLDPRLKIRSQLETFWSESDSTKLYEHLLYAWKHARSFYKLLFFILTATSKTDPVTHSYRWELMLRLESDVSGVTWLESWKSRNGGNACLTWCPVLTQHTCCLSRQVSLTRLYILTAWLTAPDPAFLSIGDSPPAWCAGEWLNFESRVWILQPNCLDLNHDSATY